MFPTSAISNRRIRRTRCTPNLHQTSDILIEVHINEMVSIYVGFIASLSRIDTTNPPRPSKSARHRPSGAVIDTFWQQDGSQTSAQTSVSCFVPICTWRKYSMTVSCLTFREIGTTHPPKISKVGRRQFLGTMLVYFRSTSPNSTKLPHQHHLSYQRKRSTWLDHGLEGLSARNSEIVLPRASELIF